MIEDLPASTLYLQILGFTVTLLLCALFSFLETTVTALRLFKLKELSKRVKRYSNFFTALEEQPSKVLFTILIAKNLVDATCVALITSVMQTIFTRMHFSEGFGLSVGVAVSTIMIIIFGEMIPKSIARLYGDRLLPHMLGIANFIYLMFLPVVGFFTKFSDLILSKIVKNKSEEDAASEQEVKFLIEYISEKGIIEQDKKSMLHSIFDLSQTSVKEIAIPENRMITITADSAIEDAMVIFTKHQYSRLPVYEDHPENIIGIIYQKDIFFNALDKSRKIKEFIRPIMFVPEGVKISWLLKEFKHKKMHMAIVLNEFGGIEGLVTLEDVLEEIVGPISDEHEAVVEKVTALKGGSWIADASVELDDIKDIINIEFEAKDALTLGGFLIEQMEHLPVKGEMLRYKGLVFQVQRADNKKVLQVLIFKDTISS